MKLSLIVALSDNGAIGLGGQLPWRMSADLRRFKRLTMGHHVLMGRKTFESIGRPLPGRTMIVITRQAGYRAPGARVAGSLRRAIQLAEEDDEAFVIGGSDIFRLALPSVDRMYITHVHTDAAGDVFFPHVDWDRWKRLREERFCADPRNEYDYSFCLYQRRRSGPEIESRAVDGEGEHVI